MKLIKKVLIMFVVVCSFLGTMTLQKSIQIADATEKVSTGIEIIKNTEAPKGVEFHQTLVVDDGIYVVGTSSARSGDFNFGGTETFPKIFVAKYSKDLSLEKIIDTGYKYEYQSLDDRCTAAECKEQDVVTLLHPGREELRFILQMKDDFLYVVGSHSTDKTTKMGCGVSCNLTEQERRIFVNKYSKKLDVIKAQTFGKEITEYIAEGGNEVVINLRNYKALFMKDGIYIRYNFFANRVGSDQGVLKINFDDVSISKNHVLEDKNDFAQGASVYDIMPYGDNIAILEQPENQKEQAWYEYNANLERQGEITKEGTSVTSIEKDASKMVLNDETFYLNSGKLYRSKTAAVIREQECKNTRCEQEYAAGRRQFQDELGDVYGVNIEDNKELEIQLLDVDGKTLITKMKIPFTADVVSLSISGNNQTLVVSANNKLYTLKKPRNQTINNTKENCYQKSALQGSEVAFKDPKTNSCYTIVTRAPEAEKQEKLGFEITQKVLKDGKEIFDMKSLDKFKGSGVMIVHPLLAVTESGDIVISGIYGKYGTGYIDSYYTVVIDGKTKTQKGEYVDNDSKPKNDSWKWWVSYQKVTTDGKSVVISGTRTQRFEKENTMISEENQPVVPVVLVLNEKLELEKVLLTDETNEENKYSNYHIANLEMTNKYIKTIIQAPDGDKAQMFIYNRESKTVIEEITNDVYNEAKTVDGSISLENGKITEKNNEGKTIKEQNVSIQNARITPMKINNNYIVANRSDSGKVVFHLIGDDGKALRKLETEINIEQSAILIFDGVQKAFDKLSFYTVQKDGVSKQVIVNAGAIQEQQNNSVFIAMITAAIVTIVAGTAIVVVLIRRKKKIVNH